VADPVLPRPRSIPTVDNGERRSAALVFGETILISPKHAIGIVVSDENITLVIDEPSFAMKGDGPSKRVEVELGDEDTLREVMRMLKRAYRAQVRESRASERYDG
jgi:hypothetical protein